LLLCTNPLRGIASAGKIVLFLQSLERGVVAA
jgi:hypothetical protein